MRRCKAASCPDPRKCRTHAVGQALCAPLKAAIPARSGLGPTASCANRTQKYDAPSSRCRSPARIVQKAVGRVTFFQPFHVTTSRFIRIFDRLKRHFLRPSFSAAKRAASVCRAAHARCLFPRLDGAVLSSKWKGALRDKSVTTTPAVRVAICHFAFLSVTIIPTYVDGLRQTRGGSDFWRSLPCRIRSAG